jgi:predicted permease
VTGPKPPDKKPERRRAEEDVDAELAFHRRATIDELRAAGLDDEAAEAEAARRFGSWQSHRRRIVDIDLQTGRPPVLRALASLCAVSLRSVIRDIRRAPGFTLGVIFVLTLGLGINAITMGLVDRLVMSGPAGVQSPESLRRAVLLRSGAAGEAAVGPLSYLDYQDIASQAQFAGAAAESATPLLFGSGEQAEPVQANLVTASYFPLLGVTPAAGRFFTDVESSQEGQRLVVLSHAFWQSRFGGDPKIIGQSLQLEDHRYTVVGIAPPRFTGSSVTRVDVFLPLEAASDEQVAGPWRTKRGFRWIGIIARLKPGATAEAAGAEATSRYERVAADQSNRDGHARFVFTPLNPVRGASASGASSIAALVGGVAAMVLLIAFANVANLFLARAVRRREQIALRLALGGGRWRLIGEQAAEGSWLALIGVTIAMAAATIWAPALQRLLFPKVDWIDATVKLRLLLPLCVVAIAGGALAAALPMWQMGRGDVARWIAGGAQRGGGRRRTRSQSVMLVVQAALSVLLLSGAGLFVRSMMAAQSLPLGLAADQLMVLLSVSGETPPPADFQDRMTAAALNTPGVRAVTRVSGTLPFVSSWAERVTVPGLAELPRVEDGGPYMQAVEPGYFEIAGTRIIEGRAFTAQDRAGSAPVAIVSQTMARLYWPGQPAIGKCIKIGEGDPPCTEVVGVAENVRRQSLVESDTLLYDVPLGQAPQNLQRSARLLIRVSADQTARSRLPEALRRSALGIAPSLRYVAARSLDDLISPQLRTWRLGAGLFTAFGVLALIVATIGLYSVVTFDVEGRRREMGIRAALGASSSSLVALVVRDALRTAAVGVVLGVMFAWLLTPLVADLLYASSGRGVPAFMVAGGALLAAAFAASAIPGLRASRVDPTLVLRDG